VIELEAYVGKEEYKKNFPEVNNSNKGLPA